MKARSAALAVVMAVAMFPSAAKADNAVVIGNVEPETLKFSLRCVTGDTRWKDYSIASGEYKAFDAADWRSDDCDGDYEMQIGTIHDDDGGRVTKQNIRLIGQHTYVIVKTQSVGFYAHDAKQMLVFSNASNHPLTLTYGCGGSSHELSVGAHETSWLFTGYPPPCSPYYGTVYERGRKAMESTPMPAGYTFKFTWNDVDGTWGMGQSETGADSD